MSSHTLGSRDEWRAARLGMRAMFGSSQSPTAQRNGRRLIDIAHGERAAEPIPHRIDKNT
jgi:hypothetical protein